MWFSKNKEQNLENILYISIDGRSIGIGFYTGTVCHYSERRIHISGESVKPIETLFKDIFYAFKNANTKPIDEIIVILESPWIKEKSTTIKYAREKPWLITANTVTEVIKKNKDLEKNTSPELGFIVESIKLNGYTYQNPIGKITEEIEISITSFNGDIEIISFFEESIKNFWNKTKITFKSGSEYILKSAKERNIQNDMYIYLGSTDTLMYIYSQGVVNRKVTVPFGFQHILNHLNKTWSTNSNETKHWIELFINENLEPTEQKKVDADIRNSLLDFINLLSNASQEVIRLSLERPITCYSSDVIWKNLFIYMLKNKYFGDVFPNIEHTIIQDLGETINNYQGDFLIALYVNEVMKEYAKKSY